MATVVLVEYRGPGGCGHFEPGKSLSRSVLSEGGLSSVMPLFTSVVIKRLPLLWNIISGL